MKDQVSKAFAGTADKPSKSGCQEEIAALAYEFWLARGFRDGSPEEDLLRALCAYPGIRISHQQGAAQ